jgi:hypothetical protein
MSAVVTDCHSTSHWPALFAMLLPLSITAILTFSSLSCISLSFFAVLLSAKGPGRMKQIVRKMWSTWPNNLGNSKPESRENWKKAQIDRFWHLYFRCACLCSE